MNSFFVRVETYGTIIASQVRMILFYSDFCPHCRMLIDTINRHDVQGAIKRVSIEALKAAGKQPPPQIKSVPALVLLPSKDILLGKAVFDYLLLPGKGKLLTSVGPGPGTRLGAAGGAGSVGGAGAAPGGEAGEPGAYSITSGSLSDAFASFDENDTSLHNGRDDRAYAWATLDTVQSVTVFPDAPFQEETRAKKGLPDLDAFKAQRDLDLTQSDMKLPPQVPAFSR